MTGSNGPRALMLAVALCAGCNGRTGGTDAGTDAVPADAGYGLEDAFREGAEALCARVAECSPLTLQLWTAGDVAACVERETVTTVPALSQPGVTGTPAEAMACTAAMLAAPCRDIIRTFAEGIILPECMLFGSLGSGAACSSAFHCASGFCRRDPGTSCGVCADRIAVGQPCTLGNECAMGAACIGGSCVALGETGAPCDVMTAPCHADLGCVMGTCGPPLAAGAACATLLGECDLHGAELVCDPVTYTCNTVTYAAPGETCGVTPTGPVACAAGGCFPDLLAGTCVANAPDGAACDPAAGPACSFHSHCVGGTCEGLYAGACG